MMTNLNSFRRCFLVLFCGGVLFCTANTTWAIHFGQPVEPGDYVSVGLVSYTNAAGETSIGTGTLISPDIVLTAAHVVESASIPYQVTFTLDQFPDQPVPVIAYRIHPGWAFKGVNSELARASDLALLKLDRAFPDSVRPFKVTSVLPPVRSSVHVVGYGRDEALKTGVRKHGQLKFLRRMPNRWLLFGPVNDQFQRTDHGDSGGPLFIEEDNEFKIIGIVQGYDGYSKIRETSSDEYGAYVSTGRHIDWIENKWKELMEVPRPPEKFCYITRPPQREATVLQPPLSHSQIEALFKVGTQPERIREKVLARGLCDWIELEVAKKWAENNIVPDQQFTVVTRRKN